MACTAHHFWALLPSNHNSNSKPPAYTCIVCSMHTLAAQHPLRCPATGFASQAHPIHHPRQPPAHHARAAISAGTMKPAFVLLLVAAALVGAVNAQGASAGWAAPARLQREPPALQSWRPSRVRMHPACTAPKQGRRWAFLPPAPIPTRDHAAASKTLKHTKSALQIAASSRRPPALPPPASKAATPPTGSGRQAAKAGSSALRSRPTPHVTAPRPAAPRAPQSPPSSSTSC